MNNNLVRPSIQRVDDNDLTFVKPGTYIGSFFNYQNEPFTGYRVLGYHDNGNIEIEYEYFEGEQMGWEVEYYENGKVKDKTLMYGATSIVYYEYDEAGNETEVGFVAPKALYNECARLIGMEEIDESED